MASCIRLSSGLISSCGMLDSMISRQTLLLSQLFLGVFRTVQNNAGIRIYERVFINTKARYWIDKISNCWSMTLHLRPRNNREFKAPSTRTRIFLNPQLFFPDSKISPSTRSAFKSNSPVHRYPMVSGLTLVPKGPLHQNVFWACDVERNSGGKCALFVLHVVPPYWFIVRWETGRAFYVIG